MASSVTEGHIKKLRDAGLVDVERRGLWAYYYVVPGALDDLGVSRREGLWLAQTPQMFRFAVLRTALTMNLVLTGALVALIYLFSRLVVQAFLADPQVVELAQHLLDALAPHGLVQDEVAKHVIVGALSRFGAPQDAPERDGGPL